MLDGICKYDLLGIVVVLLQVKFLCNLFNCLFHTKYISQAFIEVLKIRTCPCISIFLFVLNF